jgi:hypothetical protein
VKRVALILGALVVLSGAMAWLSIRVPLHGRLTAIRNAHDSPLPKHVRDAFTMSFGTGTELQAWIGGPRLFAAEKTLRRRLVEISVAAVITARYDDEAVLRAYLQDAYFGQDGKRQIIGIRDASRVFFKKDVAEMSLAEAALLAGIMRSPNVLSPLRYPDRARRRRNAILGKMLELRLIDRAEHEAAAAAPTDWQ